MKIDIRPLNYRDSRTTEMLSLDELSNFYSTCFNAEYSRFLNDSAMRDMEAWTSTSVATDLIAIDCSDTRMYAGFDEAKLVGTAVYAQRQGYVYVWAMYVHPNNIRTGIGARLLKEIAKSVAVDSRIEVSVAKQSSGAMDFYKKNGFQTYKSKIAEVFPHVEIPIDVMQCETSTILGLRA